MSNNLLWQSQLSDGTSLEGVRGGETHAHEISPWIGQLKVQQTSEHIPYNNFSSRVSELLQDNGIDPG